jgi:hypothetical protein
MAVMITPRARRTLIITSTMAPSVTISFPSSAFVPSPLHFSAEASL